MRSSLGVLILAALAGGACVSKPTVDVTPPTCTALDACHVVGEYDSDVGACTNPLAKDGTACIVSNTCNVGTTCAGGACQGGTTLADGVACDDHDACTQTDVCAGGTCLGSDPLSCPQAIPICYASPNCDPSSGCPGLNGPCSTTLAAPLPLYGCPSSDFYGVIQVGDQNFAVLMDSGSTTLALAGSHCATCGGLTPNYVPGPTATDQHKVTSSVYGDQTGWIGEVYSDTVRISALNASVPVKLASMTDQNGFFRTEDCGDAGSIYDYVQGILGLGGIDLATPNTDSFIVNMAQAANLPQAFATSFCDTTGNLWLGGYDPNTIMTPVHFTSETGSGYYSVVIDDMQLNGVGLGFSSNEYETVVVDTGTSELLLPLDIANAFAKSLELDPSFSAAFNPNFIVNGDCMAPMNGATREQLDADLPVFTVVFPTLDKKSTFSVSLPATLSYLGPLMVNGQMQYCALIAPSPVNYLTILGNAVMRSQLVVFDATDKKVGFATQKATCDRSI